MSKISDFPVGAKVGFVEDYKNFFRKGEITTIGKIGYYDFEGALILNVAFRNMIIGCYSKRVKRLYPDNELNRILYPELKPDGKGYLL